MFKDGNHIGTRPGCKHEFVEGDSTDEGLDGLIDTLHIAAQESATDICKRLHLELVKEWRGMLDDAAKAHQLWQTMGYLIRVMNHCEKADAGAIKTIERIEPR